MAHIEHSYRTERLVVMPWRRLERERLIGAIMSVLTPATTDELPSDMQGVYDADRARQLVDQRETDGPTLVALLRDEPVGLVLVYPFDPTTTGGVIQLGYVVHQDHWGAGLATEIVGGFVEWCRSEPLIRAIHAGTEPSNVASQRVLEKAGFTRHSIDGAHVRFSVDVAGG